MSPEDGGWEDGTLFGLGDGGSSPFPIRNGRKDYYEIWNRF
jgi:hypothetical protein